jgi:hypothetical protein
MNRGRGVEEPFRAQRPVLCEERLDVAGDLRIRRPQGHKVLVTFRRSQVQHPIEVRARTPPAFDAQATHFLAI